MVAGAMIKPEIILLPKFKAMLLLYLRGKVVNIKRLQATLKVMIMVYLQGILREISITLKKLTVTTMANMKVMNATQEDAGGAIQLGLDACRIISLAKAPVSNEKEIKKSLKGQQDPGSRPHKDHKNGQNPRRYVDKNGAARLPSRPGTTSQKKMDEFFRAGGSQEKSNRRPHKDPGPLQTHGKVTEWHVTPVELIGLWMRQPSKGIFKMPQVFEPRIGHDPVLAIASQRGNQRMYSNWMSQFPSGSNYGGRLAQLQLRFRIPLRMWRSPAWTLQMMKHCVMQCLLFELYDMIPEELSYQKTKRKAKAKVKAKAKTQTTPTPSQDPTGASGYASSADSVVEMDPGVPYDHGSLVLPKAPPKAWIARQLGAPPPAPKSATASSTGTGQAIGPKAKAKARGQDAMMLWYGAAPATKAPPEEHGDPQRDFDPPGAPYPVHPSWAPNLVANWPCHCGLEDLSVKRICLFLSTLRLLRCLMQDD
jgi:hypothetical protein